MCLHLNTVICHREGEVARAAGKPDSQPCGRGGQGTVSREDTDAVSSKNQHFGERILWHFIENTEAAH